ncbi:hypothetical protein AB4Y90_06925 [Chryseobacterium sp. 2TAF14]|uniref:hypothetical protein n=1 Tax=Chryseobacterium sp. 2TAF14 TaxID=3233007 RepID=UPI003F92652A
MQKIYHKSLLTASVLFFLLSQGQIKDSLQNQQQEREISAFKSKISQYDERQKQEVQRLKGLGYEEFISEKGNEKQLIGSDEEGRPLYYTTQHLQEIMEILQQEALPTEQK